MEFSPSIQLSGTAAAQKEGAGQQQVRKGRGNGSPKPAGRRPWGRGSICGLTGQPDFQMQQTFLREARRLGWGLGGQRRSQRSPRSPWFPKGLPSGPLWLPGASPPPMLPSPVAGTDFPAPPPSAPYLHLCLLLGRKVNRLWESCGPRFREGGVCPRPQSRRGRAQGVGFWDLNSELPGEEVGLGHLQALPLPTGSQAERPAGQGHR